MIDKIFDFKKRPITGGAVTVIPLGFDISPLTLRIVKAKKTKDPCDEHLPPQWEIALEPIRQQEFFEVSPPSDRSAEFPFDVVVLYPAVKAARLLKNDQLDLKTLPRGVVLKIVKAAIDLDEDNQPDVVLTEYCCLDQTQPLNECEYHCGKTYKKVRNIWKLVDSSSPC
jgi:hypothetical protein